MCMLSFHQFYHNFFLFSVDFSQIRTSEMLRYLVLAFCFSVLVNGRTIILIKSCKTCKLDKKNLMGMDFSNLTFVNFNNTIQFSGYFSVQKNLENPIDLEIETNRCTLKQKDCQKFSKIKFENVCEKFFNSPLFGGKFVSAIKPKMKCPALQGTYNVQDVVMDLENIAKLPFSGWL